MIFCFNAHVSGECLIAISDCFRVWQTWVWQIVLVDNVYICIYIYMQYNSIPVKTSRCDLLLLNVKHVHQLCFALARFLILVSQKTQPILQFRNHGLKQRTKDRYDGFVQLTSVCPSLRLVNFYGPQVVHGKLCLKTSEPFFSLIGMAPDCMVRSGLG